MKLKLLVAAIAFVTANLASAATVVIFGQSSGPSISATETGGVTTITSANGPLIITQIAAGVSNPFTGFLNLNIHSIDLASVSAVGNVLTQNYAGSFSITSLANGAGVNILSASFSDARISGTLTGGALEFGDTTPIDTLTFTSDIIPANQLELGRASTFSFTNLSSAVALADNSLGGFTSNFSGNDSANITGTTVPEPGTVLLAGLGMLGAVASRRGRKARQL